MAYLDIAPREAPSAMQAMFSHMVNAFKMRKSVINNYYH